MSGDYSLTVRTLTWFWFVAAVLGVATRGLTKAIIVRSLNVDDVLIAVSLVCNRKLCARYHGHKILTLCSFSLLANQLLSPWKQVTAMGNYQQHQISLNW